MSGAWRGTDVLLLLPFGLNLMRGDRHDEILDLDVYKIEALLRS